MLETRDAARVGALLSVDELGWRAPLL